MTEKEIAAEDAETARREVPRATHTRDTDMHVERFELPETGNTITFTTTKKKTNDDTVNRATANLK